MFIYELSLRHCAEHLHARYSINEVEQQQQSPHIRQTWYARYQCFEELVEPFWYFDHSKQPRDSKDSENCSVELKLWGVDANETQNDNNKVELVPVVSSVISKAESGYLQSSFGSENGHEKIIEAAQNVLQKLSLVVPVETHRDGVG